MRKLWAATSILFLVGCTTPSPEALAAGEDTGADMANKMTRQIEAADSARGAVGRGDYEGGLEILRRESQQGSEFAKLELCLFHMLDTTPERYRDLKEGAAECKYLALKDYPSGQYVLARMYMSGRGVEKSLSDAAYWFRQAAEGDDADSQYWLGVMYVTGEGVPRDPVLGYHWLNLASGQGHKKAAEMRDSLERVLSRSEIEEANRITRQFNPR
jgi:TPR repeat protein